MRASVGAPLFPSAEKNLRPEPPLLPTVRRARSRKPALGGCCTNPTSSTESNIYIRVSVGISLFPRAPEKSQAETAPATDCPPRPESREPEPGGCCTSPTNRPEPHIYVHTRWAPRHSPERREIPSRNRPGHCLPAAPGAGSPHRADAAQIPQAARNKIFIFVPVGLSPFL